MKRFRDTYTVVALDMRGFGDSDAPRKTSDYSIDVLCLDVVATIKACGYEACTLIGHDWGGMVAWNVSANFPKMINGLVTICSPHPRAYNEKQCFTLTQAYRSSYFMLFATPRLPEVYLGHNQGQEIRTMMLSSPMGVVSPGSLTEQEVDYYVSAMLRPYRLTAGLNYYRNAMSLPSKRALRFLERYDMVYIFIQGCRNMCNSRTTLLFVHAGPSIRCPNSLRCRCMVIRMLHFRPTCLRIARSKRRSTSLRYKTARIGRNKTAQMRSILASRHLQAEYIFKMQPGKLKTRAIFLQKMKQFLSAC